MTPKPEVPKLHITGAQGHYRLRCSACGYDRPVYASKAKAHAIAEVHRRTTHAKNITGTVVDTLGTTDSVDVELTTPEEDPAA
jgi:hypothetical protein